MICLKHGPTGYTPARGQHQSSSIPSTAGHRERGGPGTRSSQPSLRLAQALVSTIQVLTHLDLLGPGPDGKFRDLRTDVPPGGTGIQPLKNGPEATVKSLRDDIADKLNGFLDAAVPLLDELTAAVVCDCAVQRGQPHGAATAPGHVEPPPASPVTVVPGANHVARPSVLASAADLAAEYGVRPEIMGDALRKWAKRFPDCREPLEHPKPREPRYLYRRPSVQPVLDRFKTAGPTAGRND